MSWCVWQLEWNTIILVGAPFDCFNLLVNMITRANKFKEEGRRNCICQPFKIIAIINKKKSRNNTSNFLKTLQNLTRSVSAKLEKLIV